MDVQVLPIAEPTSAELDAYQRLNREEIARLVLCLLIEEMHKGERAAWLPETSDRP